MRILNRTESGATNCRSYRSGIKSRSAFKSTMFGREHIVAAIDQKQEGRYAVYINGEGKRPT